MSPLPVGKFRASSVCPNVAASARGKHTFNLPKNKFKRGPGETVSRGPGEVHMGGFPPLSGGVPGTVLGASEEGAAGGPLPKLDI